MSTLEVILIFAGIPLLVILMIFLLVYAPSWVRGPRYRPGQPWEANAEWFGPVVSNRETPAAVMAGGSAGAARETADADTGGASAGW